ncbi:hypothetical protein KY285_022079 [Solanum tuberosum]|nr:hypothetical protein KY285_022079 [Solanum tuberosum]
MWQLAVSALRPAPPPPPPPEAADKSGHRSSPTPSETLLVDEKYKHGNTTKNDHQYEGGGMGRSGLIVSTGLGVGGDRLGRRLRWEETAGGHISIPKDAFSYVGGGGNNVDLSRWPDIGPSAGGGGDGRFGLFGGGDGGFGLFGGGDTGFGLFWAGTASTDHIPIPIEAL